MTWQNILLHLGNFFMLPLFMGGAVGLFAQIAYFKKAPRGLLIFAAFLGCLMGLLAGWIITGQDGNMLNYGLALLSCTLFVVFAGSASNKENKRPK